MLQKIVPAQNITNRYFILAHERIKYKMSLINQAIRVI